VNRAAVQLRNSFACWTALGVTYAVNRALYRVSLGSPADFVGELRTDLVDYWIWAALTPVVFAIARRAPITRQGWPRAVILHAAAFVLLLCIHEGVAEWLHLPNVVPPDFHGRPIALRLLSSFTNDLWMYGGVLIVASSVHYYERFRERDLAAARLGEELARAQLQALRNQLNPHLLFNALNSVAALMHEDVQAADDMLGDLAHLLRVYLSGDPHQETTLREELELVEAYVGIQKRRFGERLSFAREVPGEAMGALVPALVLQPLVENAILHGIAPSARRGSVSVRVTATDGKLVLVVADDGLGMKPGKGEGIGLSNTRLRLQQLYGEAQAMELNAVPGGGVSVTLTLPLRAKGVTEGTERDEDPDADRRRRAAGAAARRVAAEGR
jgi:signal transduction histidine kinase